VVFFLRPLKQLVCLLHCCLMASAVKLLKTSTPSYRGRLITKRDQNFKLQEWIFVDKLVTRYCVEVAKLMHVKCIHKLCSLLCYFPYIW
jgi:hypothetical protein